MKRKIERIKYLFLERWFYVLSKLFDGDYEIERKWMLYSTVNGYWDYDIDEEERKCL